MSNCPHGNRMEDCEACFVACCPHCSTLQHGCPVCGGVPVEIARLRAELEDLRRTDGESMDELFVENASLRAQLTSKSTQLGHYTTSIQEIAAALGMPADPHTDPARIVEECAKLRAHSGHMRHRPDRCPDCGDPETTIRELREELADANARAKNWQQKAEKMAARNVNPKIAAKGAKHLVGIDFNLRACECDHCEDIRFVFRELAKGGR